MYRAGVQTAARSIGSQPGSSFPEWAAAEMDRLMKARAAARSPEERVRVENEIIALCDTGHRFGSSLMEAAEL